MPHPAAAPRRAKLTNQLVRARLPLAETGQYLVRDTALPGFFVLIGTRARTYTIQCDVRDLGHRRTVREAIARAEDMDADEARREARARLGAIQTGARATTPRRELVTLRQAWASYREHFEERVAAGERSAGTLTNYEHLIEGVLRDWLDRPLRELSDRADEVARRHREITQARGGYAANHSMRALRAVYRHARRTRLERGLPTESPVDAVRWNRETRRQTGMARGELAGWEAQRLALPDPVRQEFHLFMLLSGCRPGSLRRARWADLDVARRVLHFPDPKGGARKAFDLPLSRPMLRSLWRARAAGRRWHARGSETFIFASGDGPIRWAREPRARLSKLGVDLRQTWRTAAQAAGLGEVDAHILMNHAIGGVNAGYMTRGALLDHLRAQQERVSDWLMKGLEG
jgi:integrase